MSQVDGSRLGDSARTRSSTAYITSSRPDAASTSRGPNNPNSATARPGPPAVPAGTGTGTGNPRNAASTAGIDTTTTASGSPTPGSGPNVPVTWPAAPRNCNLARYTYCSPAGVPTTASNTGSKS